MTRAILFVCLGNICRSPTAEAVFRHHARLAGLDVTVDSAGTGGWHAGEPPHPPMIAAAKARGYELAPLRARQLVETDFTRFDDVLVMDHRNLADAMALRRKAGGQGAKPQLFLTHAPDCGLTDLPDPWYTGDFDHTLDLVEAASRGLVTAIRGW